MHELPSEVLDRKYLQMPLAGKVVDSDEEWSRCGKWVIANSDYDLSWTDRVWISLQALVEDGTLLMIKASTAAFGDSDQCILCYTKPEKDTIRRSAEAIRKVVCHKSFMYYKINRMTESKIDHRYGHKQISVYKHSYMGRLYRRDDLNLWKLDEDIESENETTVDVPHQSDWWGDSELSDSELPSKSTNRLLRAPSPFPPQAREYIIIRTSLKEERQGCLPEADRLWISAGRLLTRGVFKGIECRKSLDVAEFRFYVDHFLNEHLLAKMCDDVFKAANCKGFAYFRTFNEGWTDKVNWQFTSEGELCRNLKLAST